MDNKGNIWILKLKALMHDPLHKQICLTNRENHEEVAKKLLSYIISDTKLGNDIKKADHIASAISRIIIKPDFGNLPNQNSQYELESSVTLKIEDAPKFIDLFSGKEDNVEGPKNGEEVENFFKVFSDIRSNLNVEEMFLFLWRYLPEIFPWIEKHPADSRAPNHSIYDHLVQTSAVVSALPKPAFLLFSLGPVQEFIQNARKTSDLWAGSYILSYLTYKAIELVIERLGPDVVIFPNLYKQPIVDKWLDKKISNKTLKKIMKKYQNNLVDEALTIANFPNRFLAIVPYSDAKEIAKECKEKNSDAKEIAKECKEKISDAKEIAIECKEKIMEYLNVLAGKVCKYVGDCGQIDSVIRTQLIHYFQIYWICLPWIKEGDINDVQTILDEYENLVGKNGTYETIKSIKNHSYYGNSNIGTAYSLLVELSERFLASRKMVRNFEQTYNKFGQVNNKSVKKCYICGEYDVLSIDWKTFRDKNIGLIRDKEELCGVCLTKRFFPKILKEELPLQDNISFPSTIEVASAKYKLDLREDKIREFKQLLSKIESKGIKTKITPLPALKKHPLGYIDAQWLLKDSYDEERLKKEYGIEYKESDYTDIIKFLKESKIKPPTYYAILAIDGDEMGKWLKGEKMPKIGELIHEKTKGALIKFTHDKDKQELQKLLCKRHPMSASFHQAFSRRLSAFALEKVTKIVETDSYGKLIYAGGDDVLAFLPVETVLECAYKLNDAFVGFLGPNSSLSAGIIITHWKYPLSIALKKSRQAEKEAKNKYGRGAFCLKYLVRSGEERSFGGKWKLKSFIDDLVCKFKSERISTRFPYDFLEIVEKLVSTSNNSSQNDIEIKKILKIELQRIYKRKCENIDSEFLDELLKQFEDYQFEFYEFATMLLIASKLAKNEYE